MTQHFEAKKHAYRQTQDGVVVSFVVHPSDMSAELATAPLGTRYMVAFSEIGDDEQPTPVAQPIEHQTSNLTVAGSNPAGSTKDRRPFASLPLSQQAAIRCQDNDFKLFINASNAEDAAERVRIRCGVASRSEIILNTPAGDKWEVLERAYQAWRTDQQYGDSAR